MSDNLAKITKNSNGFYTWRCSVDADYYRKGMRIGIRACLGFAVFYSRDRSPLLTEIQGIKRKKLKKFQCSFNKPSLQ